VPPVTDQAASAEARRQKYAHITDGTGQETRPPDARPPQTGQQDVRPPEAHAFSGRRFQTLEEYQRTRHAVLPVQQPGRPHDTGKPPAADKQPGTGETPGSEKPGQSPAIDLPPSGDTLTDARPATDAEDPGADEKLDAATEAEQPRTERPDIAARYPADYIPSSDSPPRVEGPHDQPEGWIDGINPGRDAPGRDNNCGECSRAVITTWDGKPAVAAAMSDPNVGGEPIGRMTEWAGQSPAMASMSEIQQRLADLGPGSSAVVGCDWNHGGGHWFNAVNDGGIVKAADGQSGAVETWPPSAHGLGFDETDMLYSDAIFFTADGKVATR
jgi:hypothetical protein